MHELDPMPEAPSGRWQFGLRHLFALTTYAAAASALVVWFGPGTLMTSIGVLLAILNVRGVFARWQRGRTQWVLLIIAWGMFLISLVLPCVSIFSGYIWGWYAAWVYLVAPFDRLWNHQGTEVGLHWIWLIAMDSANLLMACLPIFLWRLSRERGHWFAAMLCVAMTGVWMTNWNTDLFVGYYVWCASFQLALVAIPLRWKTFLAMLAYCTLLAVPFQFQVVLV